MPSQHAWPVLSPIAGEPFSTRATGMTDKLEVYPPRNGGGCCIAMASFHAPRHVFAEERRKARQSGLRGRRHIVDCRPPNLKRIRAASSRLCLAARPGPGERIGPAISMGWLDCVSGRRKPAIGPRSVFGQEYLFFRGCGWKRRSDSRKFPAAVCTPFGGTVDEDVQEPASLPSGMLPQPVDSQPAATGNAAARLQIRQVAETIRQCSATNRSHPHAARRGITVGKLRGDAF